MLKTTKAVPFGSHLSTKLEGANNKLVCALSSATTCSDDVYPTQPIRRPWEETMEEIVVA